MRALLLLLLAAALSGATAPNPLASGSDLIAAAPIWTGSEAITLGRPAALVSALDPAKEYTVLVRFQAATATTVGTIISLADNTNVQMSVRMSSATVITWTVGGAASNSSANAIPQPTWNAVALINRNVSGSMHRFIMTNDGASAGGSLDGSTLATGDIMIGARRGASNADIADPFAGVIDCVGIWNAALTDDQLHWAMGYIRPSEMISGQEGPSTGLVGYWPGNEKSGTVLHDVIAGNNGTCSVGGMFQTAVYSGYPTVAVGDSLSQGNGSPTSTSYIQQTFTGGGTGVHALHVVKKYGFPGQNTAYILTQMQLPAYAPFLNWTQVIWTGRNDLGVNSTPTIMSGIASMVALIPHNRYLIMGQKPNAATGASSGTGDPNATGTEDWGTTGRGNVVSLNNAEQSTYGARYVDAGSIVTNAATLPAEGNDLFQLRTPIHEAFDTVHMIDVGYTTLSLGVAPRLTLMGW